MPRSTRSNAIMSENIVAEILCRMSKNGSYPVTPPPPAPLAVRRTLSFGPDLTVPLSDTPYANVNTQSNVFRPINFDARPIPTAQDNQAGSTLSEKETGMDWVSEEPSYSSINIDTTDVEMVDDEKDMDGDVIMKEPETQPESIEVEMSTLPAADTDTPALSFASLSTPPYQIASPLRPALVLSAPEVKDQGKGKKRESPFADPSYTLVRFKTSASRTTMVEDDEPCASNSVARVRPRSASLLRPTATIWEEDDIPSLQV